MKQQQQGLVVLNPDSVNPGENFIPETDNNQTELKKLKSKNYFTKEILEIRSQVFNKEEVSSSANTIAAVDKLIMWNK